MFSHTFFPNLDINSNRVESLFDVSAPLKRNERVAHELMAEANVPASSLVAVAPEQEEASTSLVVAKAKAKPVKVLPETAATAAYYRQAWLRTSDDEVGLGSLRRFLDNVTNLALFFDFYGLLSGALFLFLIYVFFEYLSFQLRLSIIIDTFHGIGGDVFGDGNGLLAYPHGYTGFRRRFQVSAKYRICAVHVTSSPPCRVHIRCTIMSRMHSVVLVPDHAQSHFTDTGRPQS